MTTGITTNTLEGFKTISYTSFSFLSHLCCGLCALQKQYGRETFFKKVLLITCVSPYTTSHVFIESKDINLLSSLLSLPPSLPSFLPPSLPSSLPPYILPPFVFSLPTSLLFLSPFLLPASFPLSLPSCVSLSRSSNADEMHKQFV